MKDHTTPLIRHLGSIDTQDRRDDSRFICNMDQCHRDASIRVGITLCERHLQKAWAAYQVIQGAEVPEMQEDPERDVRSLDARGTVYMIRVGDLIKIGWTSSPKQRMKELKPDAILHYKAGTRRDEYKLHALCIDHLVKGREWFASSPWMIQFVKDIQAGKLVA